MVAGGFCTYARTSGVERFGFVYVCDSASRFGVVMHMEVAFVRPGADFWLFPLLSRTFGFATLNSASARGPGPGGGVCRLATALLTWLRAGKVGFLAGWLLTRFPTSWRCAGTAGFYYVEACLPNLFSRTFASGGWVRRRPLFSSLIPVSGEGPPLVCNWVAVGHARGGTSE